MPTEIDTAAPDFGYPRLQGACMSAAENGSNGYLQQRLNKGAEIIVDSPEVGESHEVQMEVLPSQSDELHAERSALQILCHRIYENTIWKSQCVVTLIFGFQITDPPIIYPCL